MTHEDLSAPSTARSARQRFATAFLGSVPRALALSALLVSPAAPLAAAGPQATAKPTAPATPKPASTRSGSEWYSRGMDFHEDERWDEAIAAFRHAIEAGHRVDAATYNIACGYARKGDADRAFEWLGKAMEVGFDVHAYLGDDDLESALGGLLSGLMK